LAEACNHLAWQLVVGPAQERDPGHALPLAEKAVSLMPEEPIYRNTLGVVYYRLARYGPAVEELERSQRDSGGQYDGYDLFFLAMCHARLGHAAKARDCYDRAMHWLQEWNPLATGGGARPGRSPGGGPGRTCQGSAAGAVIGLARSDC
jgi:uncharacterized protein HemY